MPNPFKFSPSAMNVNRRWLSESEKKLTLCILEVLRNDLRTSMMRIVDSTYACHIMKPIEDCVVPFMMRIIDRKFVVNFRHISQLIGTMERNKQPTAKMRHI
jgi:hypothetical protein